MRTNLIATIALMVSSTTFAQVGINNNDPKATLDVTAKTTDGSKPEGIIAPRLTGAQIQLADTKYGTDQTGTLVYATSAVPTTPAPTSKFSNITGPGYYYFDGSVWQKVGAGGGSTAGDTTNDAWINDATNKIVKLGTKSDGSTARDAGTDFVANDNGNVGIGTASPNTYALLDISSSNKGMLAPRVSLATNTTDLNSDGDNNVANQPAGLLVYNTGTGTLKYVGYMFWNGTEWRSLNNSSTANGAIGSLICNSASLSPATYTAGTPYSGTLSVPYSGGNGGTYSGQSIVSTGVTGLTATLAEGNFAHGSGTLQYNITGTPSASSPNTATFALNIGGQTCSAVVGIGEETASGTTASAGYNIGTNTPTESVTCFDGGNFCIRYNGTSGNQPLQVKQSYGANQVMLSYAYWGTGSDGTSSYKNTDLLQNTWTTIYNFGGANNTEGTVITVILTDKGTAKIRSYEISANVVISSEIGSAAGGKDKLFLKLTKN